MRFLRNHWIAWGLLVFWAGAIWYGSTISLGAVSPFRLFGVDKVGHAGEYAVLGMLAANALLTLSGGIYRWDAWQGAVAISGLWGWIDEIHQYWVPGRSTDPTDLIADLLGAGIGAWLYLRSIRRAGLQPPPESAADGH